MINRQAIMEFLEREGLDEVDEIEYKESILVYNFFYTFDDDEMDAAKSYANENYDPEKGEEQWYEEYFLPYLTDVAADNVKDMLDDLCEEFELEGEFIVYEIERESYEQCEFALVVAPRGKQFNMDEILEELDL
jgi:hypothetical protein